MGWISVILSSLPAIMAALATLWSILGPLFTRNAASAMLAAGTPMTEADFTLYFYGQAGVATAVAAGCMALRPTAIEMHKTFSRTLQQKQRAARVAELREEVELLPMASRTELFGK